MDWDNLSMREKAVFIRHAVSQGVLDLDKIKNIYNSGGPVYTTEQAWRVYNSYDPSGGFNFSGISNSEGDHAKGEEDQYWKAYLGLPNNVPKMSSDARIPISTKEDIEARRRMDETSEYFGTTKKMDQNLQVLADSMNLGKISRNYLEYKRKYSELPEKSIIDNMYEISKEVLENPNKWTPIEESSRGQFIIQEKMENNEKYPLGMLGDFNMMWVPESNSLYVQDTYDFPGWVRLASSFVGPKLKDRDKTMRIRSRISFNPRNGSYLLRNNMKNYYKMAKGIK